MTDVVTAKMAGYIAAGICMGIGALGPAIGLGLIGSKACESLGKKPECADALFKVMITSAVLVESIAVYVLLISGALILYVG